MESYPTLSVDLPLKALVWEVSPSEVYRKEPRKPTSFRGGMNRQWLFCSAI
jgi:hypothetical protein